MATVTEIEQSIRALPREEFFQLKEWMCDRELEMLDAEGYESPELEAEMLKAVDGPWLTLDEDFFARIRRTWKQEAQP